MGEVGKSRVPSNTKSEAGIMDRLLRRLQRITRSIWVLLIIATLVNTVAGFLTTNPKTFFSSLFLSIIHWLDGGAWYQSLTIVVLILFLILSGISEIYVASQPDTSHMFARADFDTIKGHLETIATMTTQTSNHTQGIGTSLNTIANNTVTKDILHQTIQALHQHLQVQVAQAISQELQTVHLQLQTIEANSTTTQAIAQELQKVQHHLQTIETNATTTQAIAQELQKVQHHLQIIETNAAATQAIAQELQKANHHDHILTDQSLHETDIHPSSNPQ